MDTSDHTWNVICPPKNWRKPIPIKETDLALLDLVAKRLSLVLTRDEERKKIYLGTALTSDASIANGVRYPSGWSAEVVHDAGAEYKAVDPLAAAPLIRAFPDAQISKNFRLSEFRPGRHTYEYIRISPALVRALEEIRERAGRPLSVTSGYRPPDYNREVGGVSNSTHIDGLAADIYCEGLTTEQLYDICEKIIGKRGGVGYYPKSGFIHVASRRRYRFGPQRLRGPLVWLLSRVSLAGTSVWTYEKPPAPYPRPSSLLERQLSRAPTAQNPLNPNPVWPAGPP